MTSTLRVVGGVVLAFALASNEVMAQSAKTESFSELQRILKAGDQVTITDTNGKRASGRIGELSSSSLTLASRAGVGIVNRAPFMWWAYVESSPPSVRRKGNTWSFTTAYISAGARFLNRDHRRSS